MKILLDENKKFYKANLHCHSTYSDGRATPEKLKEEYMKRGYSAIAFTDHEHIIKNTHLTDENFVAITSCELAVKGVPTESTMTSPLLKVTHLNFYALDPENDITPFYSSVYDHFQKNITPEDAAKLIKYDGEYKRVYSHEGISEMIKKAHELGFLVSYNHPGWSLETAADYLGYEDVDFVEVRNNACCLVGHHEDEHAFADILSVGKNVFCTAADDNHNAAGFDAPKTDSFGGFVMINAEKLGYNELMTSLKNGDFYASGGPEIYSLKTEGNMIYLKCSPVKKIAVISRGRAYMIRFAEPGKYITDISIKLREGFTGFRLKLIDEYNMNAWTQYYEMDREELEAAFEADRLKAEEKA